MKALLLENIHPDAAETLEARGYDVELRAGSLSEDELLWGAAWLSRASKDDTFLQYIHNNGKTLGAEDSSNEFGWDNKHAGLNVLVSKVILRGCFHPSTPLQSTNANYAGKSTEQN